MEFPRLVYKSASVHELAEDAKHFDSLISAGWFPSVPDAIAGKKAVSNKDESPVDQGDDPTRDELEQKATELGIKFDKRTSDAKLVERIAELIG